MVGELRASHVIHLHRLLSAVRAEFHEHGMDVDLGEYESHDVAPADFKATKSEHERALLTLSAALAEWAEGQTAGATGADDAEPGGEGESQSQSEVEVDAESGDRRREAGATR